MSMEEWPDDHLDELFRKSAEEHDIPFNPDDWADMDRRLAEHDQHQLYGRVLRWVGAGALLLLLLGGLIYEGQQNTTPPALTRSGQPRRFASIGAEANLRRQAETTRVTASAHVARRPDLASTPPARTRPSTETGALATLPRERLGPVDRMARQPVSAVEPVSGPERSNPLKRERQVSAVILNGVRYGRMDSDTKQSPSKAEHMAGPNGHRPALARAAVAASQLPDTPGSAEPDQPVRLTNEPVSSVEPAVADRWLPTLTPASSQSSLVQPANTLPNPALADVPVVRRARAVVSAPLRRLSVLLFASPDLSAIGLKNFERPGSNAGLAIQYQISDRLSIHTGAMLSTKRYQTYSDDYVWPSNWVWKVWPSEIVGTCRMIDVPLNIRYDWLVRPRPNGAGAARWFASTGLTSYFIQRETYVYEYDDPNDPDIQGRGWDNLRAGRPGGAFGFSNLNLSVGYERPITQRLSWQVEPFMKVPLQQVGFFRVKLLSTGAFVGLRYRL